MLVLFISAMVLFIVVTMRSGLDSWADTVRKVERVTAMKREAGTPLPDTSPMQKKSFSSRM